MRAIAKRPALLVTAFALLLILLTRHARSDDSDVVFTVGFADYASGPVLDWLKGKGFAPEQDMKNQRKISLTASDRGLVMEAKGSALGLLVLRLSAHPDEHRAVLDGV